MTIEENIPLAPFTTFRIGGPARFFTQVKNVEELRGALAFAKEKNLRTFVLGGGSNVLLDDKGFDGLAVKVDILGVEEKENLFVAGAGESWDALVTHAVTKNLWGIENLSGIPGTVGGAVVQNIGAYGQALFQTFKWAEVLDTRTGVAENLTREECLFGYRDSVFKQHPGRYIILRAALQLSASPTPELSYKDLAARFKGAAPTLTEIRDAILAIRAGKFPDLQKEGTAGSFFKNPVLPAAKAQQLKNTYPALPLFPLPESPDVKVPLGWFLDYRHGVIDARALRVGGARMYEKQFLVLVAEKNTSSADVKALAQLVKQKIKEEINVTIEEEVTIV